ncbi:hypothetical protein FB451DRAFT_1179850 [Mycena latifolia]|nr:hypothetical protein FB451DRAFT_1179850 [Mycena latifolia]
MPSFSMTFALGLITSFLATATATNPSDPIAAATCLRSPSLARMNDTWTEAVPDARAQKAYCGGCAVGPADFQVFGKKSNSGFGCALLRVDSYMAALQWTISVRQMPKSAENVFSAGETIEPGDAQANPDNATIRRNSGDGFWQEGPESIAIVATCHHISSGDQRVANM